MENLITRYSYDMEIKLNNFEKYIRQDRLIPH